MDGNIVLDACSVVNRAHHLVLETSAQDPETLALNTASR